MLLFVNQILHHFSLSIIPTCLDLTVCAIMIRGNELKPMGAEQLREHGSPNGRLHGRLLLWRWELPKLEAKFLVFTKNTKIKSFFGEFFFSCIRPNLTIQTDSQNEMVKLVEKLKYIRKAETKIKKNNFFLKCRCRGWLP